MREISFLVGIQIALFVVKFSSQSELFLRSGDVRYATFSSEMQGSVYNQSGQSLSRQTVDDPIDCYLLCLGEGTCWAVNYGGDGEGKFDCELLPWSAFDPPRLQEKDGFSHARIMTPCDESPCEDRKACRPIKYPPHYTCDCVLFDFENGIAGWSKTGTAFDNQPTYGDNPTLRNKGQAANQAGDWWIGTYENRPSPSATPGAIQGDGLTGTLTSPEFQIRGKALSFLIGGGCDINAAFAELLVEGTSVSKATGLCHESMVSRQWDVSAYTGKKARIRLVDLATSGWGHINFDHLVNSFCAEGFG